MNSDEAVNYSPVALFVYHLLYFAPGIKPQPTVVVNVIEVVFVLKDEP